MPVVSKGIWDFRASRVILDNGLGSHFNPTNLILTINNQIYTIPPTSYINAENDGVCTFNLFATRSWTLGQSFLGLYATVYDVNAKRIGS